MNCFPKCLSAEGRRGWGSWFGPSAARRRGCLNRAQSSDDVTGEAAAQRAGSLSIANWRGQLARAAIRLSAPASPGQGMSGMGTEEYDLMKARVYRNPGHQKQTRTDPRAGCAVQ